MTNITTQFALYEGDVRAEDIVKRPKFAESRLEARFKPKSWVIGFIDLLYVALSDLGTGDRQAIQDWNNTTRNIYDREQTLDAYDTGGGSKTKGIVCGTGTTAVSMTDYYMETVINHGTGAGELQYGNSSKTAPATVGSTRSFTHAKLFTNGSGSDITVEEWGLMGAGHDGGGGRAILLERTVYQSTITNGNSKTATYTIGITV